jgi:hypothetical protein
VLTSGVFESVANFLVWLVTLNMTQSNVSIVGEIFVKIATWAISYIMVGLLFNSLGWFNSDAMKIAYFIISTLISFALCYVVMLLETYLLYIVIVAVLLLAVLVGILIFSYIRRKRNNLNHNKV